MAVGVAYPGVAALREGHRATVDAAEGVAVVVGQWRRRGSPALGAVCEKALWKSFIPLRSRRPSLFWVSAFTLRAAAVTASRNCPLRQRPCARRTGVGADGLVISRLISQHPAVLDTTCFNARRVHRG